MAALACTLLYGGGPTRLVAHRGFPPRFEKGGVGVNFLSSPSVVGEGSGEEVTFTPGCPQLKAPSLFAFGFNGVNMIVFVSGANVNVYVEPSTLEGAQRSILCGHLE